MGNLNSRNFFNKFLQSSYLQKFRPVKYKRHTVSAVLCSSGSTILHQAVGMHAIQIIKKKTHLTNAFITYIFVSDMFEDEDTLGTIDTF